MITRYYKLLYVFLSITLLPVAANGATHYYARENGGSYGSEDGSDWSNAFDGLPDVTSMDRSGGDVYIWLAGGTYTTSAAYELDTPESGTNRMVIQKADADDASCTGATGWSSSFATTQAEISSTASDYKVFSIDTGYWTISGTKRNEDDWSSGGDYGLQMGTYNLTADAEYMQVNYGDSIEICYIYFLFPPDAEGYDVARKVVELQDDSNSDHIHHNYTRYQGKFIQLNRDTTDDAVIEYNYIQDTAHEYVSAHHDTIDILGADGGIVRYNYFDNTQMTIVDHCVSDPCTQVLEDWEIYNNIFFDVPSNDCIGTVSSAHPSEIVNWKVYNNTFVDNPADIDDSMDITSLYFSNNLIFNETGGGVHHSSVTFSNNYYNNSSTVAASDDGSGKVVSTQTSAQTFANYSGNDFSLVLGSDAIDVGADLSATVPDDFDGVTRPKNSIFDIGAYEYNPGSPATSIKKRVEGFVVDGKRVVISAD